MNRSGSLLGSLEVPLAIPVAAGVIAACTLALLAVLQLGLPIWSLLLVVAAALYVFLVLHRPVVGLLAVMCLFFLPHRMDIGISLLQVGGVATAGLLLIWFLYQRRTIVLGNIVLPLFIMGVLIIVSFWFTRDAPKTTFYFLRWLFNMMFVLLMLNLVTRFDTFRKLVWCIIVIAALNAVVGVYDFATSSDWNYRSMGLLGNPNALGHLAALAVPLALYQYLYRSGFMRWLGLTLSLLLSAGVVVAVSRGATASLLVVCLAILVTERRRIIPLVLVFALGLSIVPFLPDFWHHRIGNLATDVKRSLLAGEREDLSSRGYLNSAGLKIWLGHPVLGVGIGNFGDYYVEKEFNPGLIRQKRIVAHNVYIQVIAEMGIVGAVVFVWLLLLTGNNILRARRSSTGNREHWMYFGAVEMMTLAILVSISSSGSIMDNDFWMFIGLAAVSRQVAATERTEASTLTESVSA